MRNKQTYLHFYLLWLFQMLLVDGSMLREDPISIMAKVMRFVHVKPYIDYSELLRWVWTALQGWFTFWEEKSFQVKKIILSLVTSCVQNARPLKKLIGYITVYVYVCIADFKLSVYTVICPWHATDMFVLIDKGYFPYCDVSEYIKFTQFYGKVESAQQTFKSFSTYMMHTWVIGYCIP